MTPVLEMHDVTVRFRMPERRIPTFKEWVIRRITSRMTFNELAALSGVDFSLEVGETLGVIGSNGAGKSTLLRVAAGIIPPTEGHAVVRGRLAPIIELGTGFEMELSGRENVFFNGALLGRSKTEMLARYDEIIDFSGIEDFIDSPLRTYSTGMVARLAFAVATTVDADILLLDEVLSVGDEAFRAKCAKRINDFRGRGVTILYVSHDLKSVEKLCSRALWLDHGRVRAIGPAEEVVVAYKAEVTPDAS